MLVDVFHGDQQAFCASHAAGAARNGLGLPGGMAIAAVIDDGNAGEFGVHGVGSGNDFEKLNTLLLHRWMNWCGCGGW
ncbi:hypothetical protein D3C72_1833040 [compost metagenome]